MELKKIDYKDLNARQKEIYNFQKVAAVLADYGFNCIKLTDDWQDADFLAYHKDGKETLRIQLKARLTIKETYQRKNLYITFPIKDKWYLIEHDELVKYVRIHTNWLNTTSWLDRGIYSSASPNRNLLQSLKNNLID
ncbi:MAG: hypothetical protein ACMZ7B_03085 [Balneola sp.]